MATEYNFIHEITPLRENMTIKVRIIRLWKPPNYNNPSEDGSIEMVLQLLHEGQLRVITNFGVGESTGNYKPTQHPYKINFFFTTLVHACDNLAIPRYGFNFMSFDDILSKQLDDRCLIDIIGQVVAVGPLEINERNGKPCKKIMMELNDDKARKLKCTLWDIFAEEASNFLSDNHSSPIILIIQFAKIKEWKDNEIREITTPTYCITLATIVAVQLEHGWYYLACKKCNKKVSKEREDVSANNGSRFALELLMKVMQDDDDSYPEELNTMVGRKLLFNVEISDYNIKENWRVYTVTKMSDNESLIQSYLSTFTTNHDLTSDSTSIDNIGKKTPNTMEKDSISCMGDNDQLSNISPISSPKSDHL
ncbi:Replication protein A 70 kDa DNA-binding subunit E, partial [Bienertia sinuspersici]